MKTFLYLHYLYLTLLGLHYSSGTVWASNTNPDSTSIPKYEECTHPGKYEPIGVLASCCTGKKDWTFSYSYMDVFSRGNKMGIDNVTDDLVFQQYGYMMATNTMQMHMHMMMVMYGFSNRFSAMGMVTYNQNNMTMNGMSISQMSSMTGMQMGNTYMPTSSYTSGLGDTKLFLFYKLRQECKYNIILGAGANIPTGSTTLTGATILGDNQRLPYPMQLGTGTWDIMPSITYFGQHLFSSHERLLSYGMEARAIIAPANNSQGYSYGDQYSLTAWLSYKFVNWASISLRVKGNSQGQISGFDPGVYPAMFNDPNSNPSNYGGLRVDTFVGMNFYLNKTLFKNLRLLLEYGIPVFQNLNGTQMSEKGILHTGIKYSF